MRPLEVVVAPLVLAGPGAVAPWRHRVADETGATEAAGRGASWAMAGSNEASAELGSAGTQLLPADAPRPEGR